MSKYASVAEILRHFPGVDPRDAVSLGNAGGFSGAELWKITSPAATLCLRKWPPGHPSEATLRRIHGMLRHAADQGLTQLPTPLLNRGNDTVVKRQQSLYELTPWMPGHADYSKRPNSRRLTAAMTVLARFHAAVLSYPAGNHPVAPSCSPGLVDRQARLDRLIQGEFDRLAAAVTTYHDTAIRERGRRILGMFPGCAPRVRQLLARATPLRVSLQPCLRDIWHDHVLFTNDEVTGLIDFGAMRTDNIACDLARLIGSLAGDDRADWSVALEAYQAHRALSGDEHLMIRAFDRSGVLMSGLSWLQWICVEGRRFDDHSRVHRRLDENLLRMERLLRPGDEG